MHAKDGRDDCIRVTLTPLEKELIRDKARRARMTMSKYVRLKLLKEDKNDD